MFQALLDHFLDRWIIGQWQIGVIVLVGITLWRMGNTIRIYCYRPRNIQISGRPLLVGKWFSSLQFIMNAPRMIDKAYAKGGGAPFAIPALNEYQVLVSSAQHIKEIDGCSPDTLSFHQAMEDRLRFKSTCYGLETGIKSIDPHDTIPGRTLKFLLRTHLNQLRPRIQTSIEQGFAEKLEPQSPIGGWKSVSVFSLAEGITVKINNQVLVGEELANNKDFCRVAVQYSHDTVIAMELCRHIPEFLVPLVAGAIMTWSGAVKKLVSFLTPVVEKHLHQDVENYQEQPLDCISWVIDSSHTPKQRTTKRIVQQILGLMFASTHQMPMALSYVIYNLCDFPEYIEPLRREIETMFQGPEKNYYKHMPLLESFLRESARLSPLDALSVQRKALKAFRFSDGSYVPKGNLVAVAQQCLMKDPKYYHNPMEFNGFRFVTPKGEEGAEAITKFTDIGPSFPFWGASKKTCSGRWYASAALKQTIVHLLTKYEFRLADKDAPRSFTWTTAVVPRHSTKLLLRERK